MTTENHQLVNARKSFLAALNDPQIETELLHSTLRELKVSQPDLVVNYVADDNHQTIQDSSLNWNELYFSQQKKVAERNFSLQRLEHLIMVREHFRQEGRKGFVPNVQAAVNPHRGIEAGYSPSINLRKFLEEGDLTTLRMALILELEDKRLDALTLRSALAWAKARVPDLCEPYSEKAFARAIKHDRGMWTEDYYGMQAVYLDTNFAEERFLHLIEVREHLRQQTVQKPERKSKPAPIPISISSDHQPSATPQGPRLAPTANRNGLSPTLVAALLIGGALAAVVILVLASRIRT